jgi:hypothetical protein
MMRSENHLELILVEALWFLVSLYVCIPPISCGTYKMMWGQQDLLPVVALYKLKFLLHHLEPVIGVHQLYRVWEVWQLGPLEASKSVSLLWLRCLLMLLHIDHGLLHGLEQWSLHCQNMLQSWWRVSSIGVVIPCVAHLKDRVWWDKQERVVVERWR